MSKRARNEAEAARYPQLTVEEELRRRREYLARETVYQRAVRLAKAEQIAERQEKDRNTQMPSKRPPRARHVISWAMGRPYELESLQAFARRRARWFKRHGKKK